MPGNKSSIRGVAKMITNVMAGKPITGGNYPQYLEESPGKFGTQEEMDLKYNEMFKNDGTEGEYIPIKNTYSGKLTNLLLACALLITIALIVMYFSEQYRASKEGDDAKTLPELLGFSGGYSTKQIFVGMMSNLVFGFIDNAGLFFGMDALDPFIPGGELTKAGMGNTFSDALGSFLGTFIGTSIQNYTLVTDWPLYSEVVGIIIGCLLGVYIPKKLTGKS